MSTALSVAFDLAGYRDPAERLRDILNHALDTAPVGAVLSEYPVNDKRLREVAMDAVTKSPRNWDGAKDLLYKAVRNDPELLWALLAPVRNWAVQALLTQVNAERYQAGKLRHGMDGDPKMDQPMLSPLQVMRPKSQDVARAAAQAAALTVLDTFKIDGKPLGDVTPAAANRWASKHEVKARFVRLVTQNLPPDQPIRKFRTAEDAAAMMAEAQAQADDDA